MIATGVVVEYNPFHNGHLLHLDEARKQTNADIIVAVMSGQFLQRGEPAITDKWTRARMALESGADIVIELPYAFATAHAPRFASGAIRLLDAMQCSSFCFGSEEGAVEPLQNSLLLISEHQQRYDAAIANAMAEGISYPNALRAGYEEISRHTDDRLADLSEPNNILGFQYMKAAQEIGSGMIPVTIRREGTHYHDTALPDQPIASATSIRKAVFAEGLSEVRDFLPAASSRLLGEWENDHGFQRWDNFYPLLRYAILREGPERLAGIADITEGIEHALYRAAKQQASFQGFMQAVKSKRYTWTRIQRMLVHILTGCSQKERDQIIEPSYIRLLGMTAAGRDYLRTVKKRLPLPLVSKASAISDPSLLLDIRSTDIYMYGADPGHFTAGLDYRTPPILL